MINAKTAEIKAKEEYKKYKESHLGDVSKSAKDHIEALEDMEIKLLGGSDKKQVCIIAIMGSSVTDCLFTFGNLKFSVCL